MIKNVLKTLSVFALLGGSSVYGAGDGLDRSGAFTQGIDFIFDDGNFATLSLSSHDFRITGQNSALTGGAIIDEPMTDFSFGSLSVKWDASDTVSLGIKYDQPYGTQLTYLDGGEFLTGIDVDTSAWEITGMARVKLAENIKAFAGMKIQQLSGDITVFVPVPQGDGSTVQTNYTYDQEDSTEYGYSIGAAYEIPEIFLRAAITYNSEIGHNGAATEFLGGTPIGVAANPLTAPSSVNVSLRSGIATDTLAFVNYRNANWGDFVLHPPAYRAFISEDSAIYTGEDGEDITYGVARVLSDNLRGFVTYSDSVTAYGDCSALSPWNGTSSWTLGGTFSLSETVDLTANATSTEYGDCWVEDIPTMGALGAQAPFRDNSSLRIGGSIKYKF